MNAKAKQAHSLRCSYCDGPAYLVGGDVIYPHRPDLKDRFFYLCRPCDAYVGTHKNSPVFAPLGRLANAELRRLKQAVHAQFDPLWKSGRMRRSFAYKRLAEGLGIPADECHIGLFDPDRCRAALRLLSESAEFQRATATVSGEREVKP